MANTTVAAVAAVLQLSSAVHTVYIYSMIVSTTMTMLVVDDSLYRL
jgi:hypothetical protein